MTTPTSPTPQVTTLLVRPADFPPGQLAVPCVPWLWTESALALYKVMELLPPGSKITMIGNGPSSIAASRNWITHTLMHMEPSIEWQLTIDSDMTPRPETALQLLTVAKQTGADIVSALCFDRHVFLPAFQAVPGETPYPETLAELRGVLEVARVGLGCCLIRRRVFEALEAPWFRHPPALPGSGEDYDFCDRARAAGFRIVVDLNLECGHLTVLPVAREFAIALAKTRPAKEWLEGNYVAGTWREPRSDGGA